MSTASAVTFTDKPLAYHGIDCDSKPQSFTFPYIRSEDNTFVANRLNNYIHLMFLHHAPPESCKSAPIELGENSGGMRETKSGGLLITNGGRVLKTSVLEDSCALQKRTGSRSKRLRGGCLNARPDPVFPMSLLNFVANQESL